MPLNYSFIIFASVIIATRIVLWILPKHAPKIAGFQIHHYMYGLILIVLYFFISERLLLAVGSALVVDEIPLFFMFKGWDWPDNHWKQYHSYKSVAWIAGITVTAYILFRALGY